MIREYDEWKDVPKHVKDMINFRVMQLMNREWSGVSPQCGTYEIANIEFYVVPEEDDMDDVKIEDVKVYDFIDLAKQYGASCDMSGESESVYFTYLRRNEMFPEDIEEATLRVSRHYNGQSYDHQIISDSLATMYSNAVLFLQQIPDQTVMKKEDDSDA